MPHPPVPDRTPALPGGSDALEPLIALGRSLAGARNATQVADLIVGALQRLLAPDCLLVVLVDPHTRERQVAYAHNYVNSGPKEPLIELAFDRHALLDQDQAAAAGAAATAGSWICAPIPAPVGHAIGAVALGALRANRYRTRDLELVAAVLAQAGIALENTRLLQMLSDGKSEWEQTVDALSEAFCVIDREGLVRRANLAFATLVSQPVTALAGRPWTSLVPGTWTASIAAALAAPDTGAIDLNADGRLFQVSVLRLDGFAVLAFSDQTEKKRLQEQLIQSEKMSAMGQLIAGVAHDLSNPLASVVGFADYLVETEQDAPPHLRGPLRAIQQEAERAAGIVHNLLSFARKQERRRRNQPIGAVLEATLRLLSNQLMACKVSGHLRVDPDLPAVTVDTVQMQQVFVNVINNAAQAIQGAGRPGNVWIHATRWLDGVAVTVEDDGPGVTDDVAARVFEPFFTTKPEGMGTGLGLSICHGIMREHGGRIALDRRPGGGASFRIELPGGHAPTAPPVALPVGPPGHLRILVIDDEPHILHYMRATLETWGHTVVVAEDGSEALERLRGDRFDVVITDIRMRQLGGREMYEVLVRERPELADRVVFSTGDTVRGDTLSFLESLGRPYLRKPFSLGQLRSALGAAVTRTG